MDKYYKNIDKQIGFNQGKNIFLDGVDNPLKFIQATILTTTYQNFGTRTNSTTKTKSIGLPADAQVVMVFAVPSRKLYHDMPTPARLPGLCKNRYNN